VGFVVWAEALLKGQLVHWLKLHPLELGVDRAQIWRRQEVPSN
jgi:hypothetical protein